MQVAVDGAFTVTIPDPCAEPKELPTTSQVFRDQEYTVTQRAFDYAIDEFTFAPADFCDITYSYSISYATGDKAVSFEETSRVFTFFYDSDASIVGTYTISIYASVGDMIPIQAVKIFDLTIRNPCIDPAYLTINQVPLRAGLTYSLTSDLYTF